MARAGAGLPLALLVAGCAGSPFRPDAPQDRWGGDEPADVGPAPTGERDWSVFVALGGWNASSDGNGETPVGRGSGPDGDGVGRSIRAGATFDFMMKGPDGAPGKVSPPWLPEGWRACWGVELEVLKARTSGRGSDDPALELTSVELLLPIGLRRPGPWPGADEHRFDLLLGGALHNLDLEDADLAAVQSDDSPTIGGLMFGARALVSVVDRVFLFARGEAGGASSSGDSFADEVDEDVRQWFLGAGVHVARGVTLQAGWRSLVMEREETDRDFFLIFPISERKTRTRTDLEGPYVELVVTF